MKKNNQMKGGLLAVLLIVLLLAFNSVQAQTDTAAIIKEFSKVMAFGTQPNVYYNTRINITGSPVMQSQDTMTASGIFFKSGENVYAMSGNEETFLQDGFFIQVNKDRKSIWISKSSEKIKNELGPKMLTSQMDALFRQKYNINKMVGGTENTIYFDSKSSERLDGFQSKVSLVYDAAKLLPKEIRIEMAVREEAGQELKDLLKAEGISMAGLLETENGKEFFVRKQKMTLAFDNVNVTAVDGQNMPSWKSIVEYDQIDASFKGKGIYSEYEITKLF